jgi:hypothetical protein
MHSAHKVDGVLHQESLVCYSLILAMALNSSVIGSSKSQNWDLKTEAQKKG